MARLHPAGPQGSPCPMGLSSLIWILCFLLCLRVPSHPPLPACLPAGTVPIHACGLPGFLLPWQGLEGSPGVSEMDRIGVGAPWLRDYTGELVEQM